jgi:hypothetical protein
METTTLLASIWGPLLIAVGVGIFASREYYTRLYQDLQRETFAVLLFGMIGMAIGIWHVQLHNSWNTFTQVIVSLLGWGLLLKGTAFTVAPRLVEDMAEWAASKKLVPVASLLTILAGIYLSWVGYMTV